MPYLRIPTPENFGWELHALIWVGVTSLISPENYPSIANGCSLRWDFKISNTHFVYNFEVEECVSKGRISKFQCFIRSTRPFAMNRSFVGRIGIGWISFVPLSGRDANFCSRLVANHEGILYSASAHSAEKIFCIHRFSPSILPPTRQIFPPAFIKTPIAIWRLFPLDMSDSGLNPAHLEWNGFIS